MEISLGTANFGTYYGSIPKSFNHNNVKLLKKALLKHKINHIDTALDYKNSNKYIKNLNIDNLKVTTKFVIPNNYKKDQLYLYNLIKKNLKLLKLKKFEAVLFHNVKDFDNRDIEHVYFELKKLKKDKLIKKIGVSIYKPNDLKKVFNFFQPEIIQAPINIFDQRLIKSNWIKIIKRKKIILQARSIFLQGFLLKNYNQIKNSKVFSNQNLKSFLKYEKFLEIKKLNKLFVCLNFIKNINSIKVIVVGINKIEELNEIAYYYKKKKINLSFKKKFISYQKNLIDPRTW
tara:strand:- start:4405 stop:5268 length:864 start_codon:yes stop_codon:yes gene_type:complete